MAQKVFKGANFPVQIDKGVGEHFFEMADKYADKILQIDSFTGQTETFKEVKLKCLRVAIYLRKIGIKRGDIVMPLCKSNLDNIVPVFAAQLLGAPVSSLDMKLGLYDIKYAIDVIRPKIIIAVEERIALIEKALDELGFETKIMAIGGNSNKYLNMCDIMKESIEEEVSFKPAKVDIERDTSFIFFSSGTTNLPKGILWSHKTLMYQGITGITRKSWSKTAPHMTCNMSSNLYWNVDIISLVTCITRGVPQILVGDDPTAEETLSVIEKYQVSHSLITASAVYRIINLPKEEFEKYDTSPLKVLKVGGSPISYKNVLRLRELFPHAKVWKLYGSSETGIIVFDWDYNQTFSKDYDTKPDSTGKVCYNIEVKIVGEVTGQALGPSQNGEILVKSPFQMLGFHNKLTPEEMFDDEGFMKTGDLGYYDEDGYFYVVDRIIEIFKYQDYKIFPTCIENFLTSLPGVKAAAVVGIPHDEDENHPAACIVTDKTNKISVDEIDDKIYEDLGDICRLRGGVKFVDELPKTSSGKVKRRAIREMFVQHK